MSFVQAPKAVVITDANGYTINLGNASGSFTQAPSSVVLTDAVGNTLNVGPGVVAVLDLTAQQADVSVTPLYTVPSTAGGMYRLSAYLVVTQAATTSCTLPSARVAYTDADTSVAVGANYTNTSTTNVVGASSTGNVSANFAESTIIRAKAGTAIQAATQGYASSGATPMQFAYHVKLEYLGA